ncbi:MAG: nucleotide sugar dehydrogenase [Gemmatimonadota bacterium]
MPLSLNQGAASDWRVHKIAVVGPGIVGMPMAALLANARILEGSETPARVVVIQRNSPTSGWKVESINAGRSPIGGIEPDLDRIVAESVAEGTLRASHDYADLRDADIILVCVQTDKRGFAPDYGPLMESLTHIAEALKTRPSGNIPLIIFESTLAPSSMTTIVRDHFAAYGLIEGRDVLLGNSPNRVMPGRLVERVAASDKLVAGLHPSTPGLIERIYRHIVTGGTLHPACSLTAEIVKTLENAYRDVRIAYSAEVQRFCDDHDINFYAVREQVNHRLAQEDAASTDPNAVPSGGILIPTIGVGGHCLPKDGILLWWRKLEAREDSSRSLILEARRINDESPAETIRLAEAQFGPLNDQAVALLGAAYRFNSEDTRNSPTLVLARKLLDRGTRVTIHDPYVYPTDQNLTRSGLAPNFTRDLRSAVAPADILIMCTAHRIYLDERHDLLASARRARGVFDGCNIYRPEDFPPGSIEYGGLGRGRREPDQALLDRVYEGFRAMETGVGNEVQDLIDFLNERYAADDFNRADFATVQRIAGTCVTGCAIADPGFVASLPTNGFSSRLADAAVMIAK